MQWWDAGDRFNDLSWREQKLTHCEIAFRNYSTQLSLEEGPILMIKTGSNPDNGGTGETVKLPKVDCSHRQIAFANVSRKTFVRLELINKGHLNTWQIFRETSNESKVLKVSQFDI